MPPFLTVYSLFLLIQNSLLINLAQQAIAFPVSLVVNEKVLKLQMGLN